MFVEGKIMFSLSFKLINILSFLRVVCIIESFLTFLVNFFLLPNFSYCLLTLNVIDLITFSTFYTTYLKAFLFIINTYFKNGTLVHPLLLFHHHLSAYNFNCAIIILKQTMKKYIVVYIKKKQL